MKKVVCSLLSLVASSLAASAQAPRVKKSHPKPPISAAQHDTLGMTCAQLTAAVAAKGAEGLALKTGANHFDLYFGKQDACYPDDEVAVPAFVRSRDINVCHVGVTCETDSVEPGGR